MYYNWVWVERGFAVSLLINLFHSAHMFLFLLFILPCFYAFEFISQFQPIVADFNQNLILSSDCSPGYGDVSLFCPLMLRFQFLKRS